jgi:plasmid stabilization system protein ParE
MEVKWYDKAQQHWDEQLTYCAETFGRQTALESIQTVEDKIERLCKFPESGTPEPLLKNEKQQYRFVHIQKRIKLIYRYDKQQETIYIVDVWNTRMSPQRLLERMK